MAGDHRGHGGADQRMLAALYGPAGSGGEPDPDDPDRQRADQYDGARALAVGLAANESFRTGQPVPVAVPANP